MAVFNKTIDHNIFNIIASFKRYKNYIVWEKCYDTKEIIRRRISKKNRQYNGQKRQWSTKYHTQAL